MIGVESSSIGIGSTPGNRAGAATAGKSATGGTSRFQAMLDDGQPSAGGGAPADTRASATNTPSPAEAGRGEAAQASANQPTEARDSTDSTDSTDDPAEAWPPLGLGALAGLLPPTAPAAALSPAAGDAPLTAAATPSTAAALPPAPALPTTAISVPAQAAGVAAAANETAQEPLPLPEAVFAQGLEDTVDSDPDSAPDTLPPTLQGLQALMGGRATTADPALGSAQRALDGLPPAVVGEPTFDDAIGVRVGWMAEQKIGHAHIRLSPDDMGTIDVRLQMDGDKVQASFSSPHVDVRHALESSLPRLRELLGEQGFQLAHADVGHHGAQGDGRASGTPDPISGGDGESTPSLAADEAVAAPVLHRLSLLDAYA